MRGLFASCAAAAATGLFITAPVQAQVCRSSFASGLFTAGITDIQRELAAHGYDPGPADGRLGPRTCHAIVAYRHDARLPSNGVVGPELQNHLHFAKPKVMARHRQDATEPQSSPGR